jgi:hypothetical protein
MPSSNYSIFDIHDRINKIIFIFLELFGAFLNIIKINFYFIKNYFNEGTFVPLVEEAVLQITRLLLHSILPRKYCHLLGSSPVVSC